MKPLALFGGEPGGNGATLIQKAGERGLADGEGALRQGLARANTPTSSSSRATAIRLTTPGGGGYGDPQERDPEAVREDVREGYVAPQRAQDRYGVSMD